MKFHLMAWKNGSHTPSCGAPATDQPTRAVESYPRCPECLKIAQDGLAKAEAKAKGI